MNCRTLPAGLLDSAVEFFHDGRDIETVYMLHRSRVYNVDDMPEEFVAVVDADMEDHPEKVEALIALGYEFPKEQRRKYLSCNFGGFDGEADMDKGKLLLTEFWPCPKRGTCSVEGVLCNALAVGNGNYLTRRELEILLLIAQGFANKEIADQLSISETTVATHNKNIQTKGNFYRKPDMVAFAYKRNLL